jgi:hypothetical protein
MVAEEKQDDPSMVKVRALWEQKQADGMTMQQLGDAMGYPPESARKSVHQFLKSKDCQVGMLRRFANAVGVKITVLVKE